MYQLRAFDPIAGEGYVIGYFPDEVSAICAQTYVETRILRLARPDNYECEEGLELKDEMMRRITKSHAAVLEFSVEELLTSNPTTALVHALDVLTYLS
jgi:hypothetical protein